VNAACAIAVLISGRDFLEQGFGRELASALPARGLSPVISWRSRCTAPEMPSLTISKPRALSLSPNFQVR
jgi:hypothetical protein